MIMESKMFLCHECNLSKAAGRSPIMRLNHLSLFLRLRLRSRVRPRDCKEGILESRTMCSAFGKK